ncbi:hypothetical protein FRC04_003992 [Tulasnella sp. 424]|nr:hypothetical protein FRC04_003992 [Tulasnella sp. 424]
MLDLGQPDFVAINGDLITGENTFKENSTLLINQLTSLLTQKNVPFASAYEVNPSFFAERLPSAIRS